LNRDLTGRMTMTEVTVFEQVRIFLYALGYEEGRADPDRTIEDGDWLLDYLKEQAEKDDIIIDLLRRMESSSWFCGHSLEGTENIGWTRDMSKQALGERVELLQRLEAPAVLQ